MTAIVDSRIVARLNMASRLAAGAVALLALVVMVGWALDIESLCTLMRSSAVAMNPLTAVAFIAAATALWLWQPDPTIGARRWWAMACAAIVTVIGGGRLLSYHAA